MNSQVKTLVFWMVIAVSAMLLWQIVRSNRQAQASPEVSYSQFISDVEAGSVASVFIRGTEIRGEYRGGKGPFRLTGPSNPGVYLDELRSKGVEVRFGDASQNSTPMQVLGNLAPLVLLGALWFFMIRQMQRRRQPPPPGPGAGPIEPR